MIVELDGQALPGFDHRISGMGQIKRKDQSGDNTSTASGHGGYKPWEIRVQLKVKFENPGEMEKLRAIYQETDTKGKAWQGKKSQIHVSDYRIIRRQRQKIMSSLSSGTRVASLIQHGVSKGQTRCGRSSMSSTRLSKRPRSGPSARSLV